MLRSTRYIRIHLITEVISSNFAIMSARCAFFTPSCSISHPYSSFLRVALFCHFIVNHTELSFLYHPTKYSASDKVYAMGLNIRVPMLNKDGPNEIEAPKIKGRLNLRNDEESEGLGLVLLCGRCWGYPELSNNGIIIFEDKHNSELHWWVSFVKASNPSPIT